MTSVDPEPLNVIYGLHDASTPDRIRYVGLTTKGVRTRLSQHICDATRRARLPVHRWVAKHRHSVVATVLDVAESPADLPDLEREWIAMFRDSGVDLLNLTDGGEGMRGYQPTAETRAKLAAARMGYIHRAETREKMSDSARARWAGDTAGRERMSAMMSEQLDQIRASAQAALSAKRADPEFEASVTRKRLATLASRPESIRAIAIAHATLTEEDVRIIRRRSAEGEGRSELGREYGVSPTAISNIALRKTWKHVA